jgi:CBS domain-containing protein
MSRAIGAVLVVPAELTGRRVGDSMLRRPKVLGASATIAEVDRLLDDDHVHAALLTDDLGVLITVLERADLGGSDLSLPAATSGTLAGRTVQASVELVTAWAAMTRAGRRRLAVVDEDGVLVGLLCLKRTGRGFCSDVDVHSRAAARHRDQPAQPWSGPVGWTRLSAPAILCR